jgi:exodeoxyribonuclease VII small subunit
MSKAKDAPAVDPVSRFEADMKALEALVQQLEASDLPLDQSIALFEQGTQLSQRCRNALDTATQRVETLTRPSSESE